MRVIVVGASKIGETVVENLCSDGHDVVIIDSDASRVDAMTDKYDCNGFAGNGASVELLKKAGIDSSKMLIAVTKSDETNILCCSVAKKLGIAHTIAAVRSPEYNDDHKFIKEQMGVSLIVNPERIAAAQIQRRIKYPDGIEIERFGSGDVYVASITIKKGNILDGLKLCDLKSKVNCDVLVCAIERKNNVISPNGQTVIAHGDKVTVLAVGSVMDDFLAKIAIIEKIIKRILIVGGSKVGYYLAELMLKSGVRVKLLDKNQAKCAELMDKYPKATVLCGDGTDAAVLEKELKDVDACVTVTGNDDVNLIISMFAKSFGIERISAEIDNNNYINMIKSSGVSHVFSTHEVSMAGVIRNARATSSDSSSDIKWLYTLNDGKVEAALFDVKDDFKYNGKALMSEEVKLKEHVLIATITNKDTTEIAGGSSVINSGDKIIVVSAGKKLAKLSDIYA